MTEIAPGEPGQQAPVPTAGMPQGGEPPDAAPATGKLGYPPTPPTPPMDLAVLTQQYQQARGELSRQQQTMAQVRERLGLDRKARAEDVLAALDAMRQPPSGEDEGAGEEIPIDPRLWEAEARAEAAQWQFQTAVYPQTAEACREFTEMVRTTSDPNVLVPAFYEILNRFAVRPQGGEEGESGGTPPPPMPPESRLDLTAGPARGPSAPKPQADLADLSGSGRVGEAVGRLLTTALGRPQQR